MKRTALKRKKPLKAKRRARQVDHDARESWARAARAKPCAVCGRVGDVEGHHILYQQWLLWAASQQGFEVERVLWDQRNMLPLCRLCHGRHHSAFKRVEVGVLQTHAPRVFQMAHELHLEYRLARTYPHEVVTGERGI